MYKRKNQLGASKIGRFLENLGTQINVNSLSPEVAGSAMALEGYTGQVAMQNMASTGDAVSAALESIYADLMGAEHGITEAQIEAGTNAALMAGDVNKFFRRTLKPLSAATENMSIVQPFGLSDVADRNMAIEAYDNRENKQAALFSIVYNVQNARQEEFGETIWPTLNVPADSTGFGIEVSLMYVFNAIDRDITGKATNFKFKNIIRAIADSSVMNKDQTRMIPVHRGQSADRFVPAALIAPYSVQSDEETVLTAPLAFKKKLDLMAICQPDSLLASGTPNQTDALEAAVNMTAVYVKFGADILRVNTTNLPTANFVYSVQNMNRMMTLNFHTTSVLVNKDTKRLGGASMTTLSPIVTNDLIVRLEISVAGTVNLQTGETSLFGNILGLHSVADNTGLLKSEDSVEYEEVKTLIDSGELLGYDLLAYRSNVNRRQRGQMLDVQSWTQMYVMPWRSPITIQRPVGVDGQTDAADVQALVTATRIRVQNEAVTALLNAMELMSEYVDARDMVGEGPDILGVGRYYIRSTFIRETFDLLEHVDSIQSHERAADIKAALTNKINNLAYNMHRDSEYKAASDFLTGGMSSTPTIIIATDPVLAQYITVQGDARTVGSEFNLRVVHTLDKRMKGRMILMFGVFDESRNSVPNPLNFGNMLWSPEQVVTINKAQDTTVSRETMVQPRYLFVVNCPIAADLTVLHVTEALAKITINTSVQP